MNVHDGMYRNETPAIPPANMALVELVSQVSQTLGRERPKKILTCMAISRDGEQLFAVDLVDMTSDPSGLSVCRAYAHTHTTESILQALEVLAHHGCRGDEPAFVCGRNVHDGTCYWAFADTATMLPKRVDGVLLQSGPYRW